MDAKRLMPFVFFGSLFSGIIIGTIGYRFYHPKETNKDKVRDKIELLISMIENEYVDEVSTDSIIDIAAHQIVSQLDPYSTYTSKKEIIGVQELMNGSFAGVGVNYYMLNDTLSVVHAIEGGPAHRAGIKAGDRILKIDNHKVYGSSITNDSITHLLKGKSTSKVNLEVYQKRTKQTRYLLLKRGSVPIKSVDVATMINDSVGFVKINRFAKTTYDEFTSACDGLTKNLKNLILDLRDNGGGYMNPALQLANQFLGDKVTIVKTIDKQGQENVTLASDKGSFIKTKIFVLINEQSASASEIVTAAIQDNDRGIVLGRRSYGKGLVQTERVLFDGSIVRLTTARYYTPCNRSIQKSHDLGFDYKYHSNEILQTKDSVNIPIELIHRTKNGRKIFGGGGIVPDLYIPNESSQNDKAIQILMKTSLVSYHVFEQIEKNRTYLEALSATELISEVKNNPIYFKSLSQSLIESGLTFDLERHKQKIQFYLIAEYLQQLKSKEDYYSWLLTEDQMVRRVLKETS